MSGFSGTVAQRYRLKTSARLWMSLADKPGRPPGATDPAGRRSTATPGVRPCLLGQGDCGTVSGERAEHIATLQTNMAVKKGRLLALREATPGKL